MRKEESQNKRWYTVGNRAAFPMFFLEEVNAQFSYLYYAIAEVSFLLPSKVVSTVDLMT